MPTDMKTFLRVRTAVERLDGIAQAIQVLAEDGAPGLENERDALEAIRRQIEALGASVVATAMDAK